MRQSEAVSKPDAPPNLVARVSRWADEFQRRHPAAGFPYAVVKKYGDDGGGREAALITYYGFLSLFPLLLLLVWSVSAVLYDHPDERDQVINAIVPADLQATVNSAISALPQSGVPLAIGLIGLLFSGLGVVMSAYHTLNHLAGIPHRERFEFFPRYVRVFLALFVLLVGVVLVGVLGLLPSVAGQIPAVADFLDRAGVSTLLLAAGSVVVVFGLVILSVMLLVCRRVRFAAVWPGALLAAIIVTLVLNLGGTALAVFVQKAGRVYGGFATVVGLFSLIYLVSQGLVYSAELALVRRRKLWPRSLDPLRPTQGDRRVYVTLAREQERIAPEQVTVRFGTRDPLE